jgi:hypothetical protein
MHQRAGEPPLARKVHSRCRVIRPRIVLVVVDDQQVRSRLTGCVADDLGLPVASARRPRARKDLVYCTLPAPRRVVGDRTAAGRSGRRTVAGETRVKPG